MWLCHRHAPASARRSTGSPARSATRHSNLPVSRRHWGFAIAAVTTSGSAPRSGSRCWWSPDPFVKRIRTSSPPMHLVSRIRSRTASGSNKAEPAPASTRRSPGAMIGFAGARVIQQATYETLPEGFQTAEFLWQHGMIDLVVPRPELPTVLRQLLELYATNGVAKDFDLQPRAEASAPTPAVRG